MQNSMSYWHHMMLQEIEETSYEKSGLEKPELADRDKDKDISSWEKKVGSAIEKNMEEGEDHEVSMANNSIETIIKHAMELKAKLGNDEKDIPAWIQDHITNAANFISQAAENYHEYGQEEKPEEETEDSLTTIMETEFISLKDFSKNLERYKNGDITKSQLINSYNKLESNDQEKAKELAKDLDVLPNAKKISEMSLQKIMEKIIKNGHK